MAAEDIKVGDIVEFASGGAYYLGAVTREVGAKKLGMLTLDGDQMRATRDAVSFETGKRVDAANEDEIHATLREFNDRVTEFAEGVDLEVLWAFVREMDEGLDAAQMAELFFDSTEPAAVLAILSVLREDIVYFKQKREVFEPRPPGQVDELKQQRAAELEKQRVRKGFVDGVVEVLRADEGRERRELAEAKMADTDFRQFARILQRYAIYDREYDRIPQANELLDEIEQALGRGLRGRHHLRAFWLMVDMTIWSEHENLWLYRYNVPTELDAEVEQAARECAERPFDPEPWRRDLTDVRCYSIDAPWTQDIDDAVSCRPELGGGFTVGVHIADPSARVLAGSLLDQEARKRGTSVYLPTGTLPMFPRELSHGAMSLVEGELRPAVSTLVTFDENLEIVDTEIVPSIVRVHRRLTYDGVDAMLASDGEAAAEPGVGETLANLKYIADELMRRRAERDAVFIDLPELKIDVDQLAEDRPVVTCKLLEGQSEARQIVSELMIMANGVVGQFCREHAIPMIYRSQDPPDGELMDADVMAMPEGLPRTFMMLRKMKSGDASTRPQPHFGLGLPVYVQSSSPIRRYSDLICQRQLKAFAAGDELPYDEDAIIGLMGTVENTTRDASITERETERYWTIFYLGTRRDEPLEATVLEHKDPQGSRVSVFLHDVALKANANMRRTVPVGETVHVIVEKANPRTDTLHLKQA